MNWFTKKLVANKDNAYKSELVEKCGGCEHVEGDASKAYIVSYENDSFGVVDGYCQCEECFNSSQEKEDNELYSCTDCGSKHPKKDMTVWTWYDFYAAQGDVPLYICQTCKTADKHVNRVRKDKEDYEWELGDR